MPRPDIQEILDRLKGVKRSGAGWVALCPSHPDKNRSLSFGLGEDSRILFKCFAGCEAEDIVIALGLEMKDLFPREGGAATKREDHIPAKSDATMQLPCTIDNYAKLKQIPSSILHIYGLKDFTYQGKAAIRISYLAPDHTEAAVRFRTALLKSALEDNRFRWKSGAKVQLYGLWRLKNTLEARFILLVEGESNCHTAWYHNIPAIGVPGAAVWKDSWSQYFDGIDTIYVVLDPDSGGEAVLKWLSKSPLRHRARLVRLKEAKDISELHCADPNAFRKKLRSALNRSISWTEYDKTDLKKKAQDAWTKCETLAREPNILQHFAESLAQAGVAGESKTAKIIFLALITRLLPKVVSIGVKAVSSAGKSFLVEKVLLFFPANSHYALTAMSERALMYSEEPLSHRFLVLYEAAGMQNEFVSYVIRSLLSEGRLRYETVEKTPAGLKPRVIEREGPTGLIVTTTNINLHPENETRMFSVSVSDSPDQTKDVMRALANEQHHTPDLTQWHALQEWLVGSEHRVTIPYAETLAELIPPVAVRLRRDFGALLNLIRAHAILHQANRQRDKNGQIIASLEDYQVVRELASEIVSEGLEMTVADAIRDTIKAVQTLKQQDQMASVTFAAAARELGIDKSTAKRRADVAIAKGYLKNQALKSRPADLVIGEPLPEEIEILPTVEILQSGCAVASDGKGTQLLSNEESLDTSLERGGDQNV